jgi:hypothetical protein
MSTLRVDSIANTANDTTVNSVEIEDSGWLFLGVDTPFDTSWVDYGSTYAGARYRKINNVVYIEGMVKNGTIGQSIFTLPVGYRPYARIIMATVSNNALGRIDVLADGTVLPQAGNSSWFSISCSFVSHQ